MLSNFEKTALLILDGWGHGPDPKVSAIAQGNTPFVDSLYSKYPNAELQTSGEAVGLPEGQMGNSEVGHLNIGAGRVVYQELVRINNAIKDKELEKIKVLQDAFAYAKEQGKTVHLMGLVSDGGVHSHINHLKALCDITEQYELPNVFIHAFMDGRDTDPEGGVPYLTDLQNHIKDSNVQIASVIGRYYAMDRDKRWERIQLAYDMLVHGKGSPTQDPIAALQASYDNGVTDEFIKPIVCSNDKGQALTSIQAGDVVLCFNFRTDRCRQISTALTQADFPEQNMQKLDLYYCTMTKYDENFEGVKVFFEKDDLKNTLGEVLAQNNRSQIRIAETEKYPHVTFFFSGGREDEFEEERRAIIPSPKVATYDLQPEMSANEITERILAEVAQDAPDFICLNYANTDMVGHTGVFEAAMKAAETVDGCVQRLTTTLLEHNYAIIIIADHGNSDYMINPDGSPHTAHTTNPVPVFLLANDTSNMQIHDGKLADIAPTLLKLMDIAPSPEMNGDVLVSAINENVEA
ncbi:MAG: 2,3-bisphosphoglycerate-independent phosphoglycerate mutase [Aureispira sp.]|nr:2,3-bisphosphoglycerate-independent phosphoglycerate mutase [Aureispira sp.]